MADNKITYDDKFGMTDNRGIKIDGIGQDAEVITNSAGGKQSKAPMAMHLVDPQFLFDYMLAHQPYSLFVDNVVNFMQLGDRTALIRAIDSLCVCNDTDPLIEIAKVLQYGADRYEPNNWRLIPQEEHINHALIHWYAAIKGDMQDKHVEHCMCRLMMAYATEPSPNFDYTSYCIKND
jgi:hypothetical protein